MTPNHVVIVLPNLAVGGAERLHVLLAREWVARGIRVEFALMQRKGELLDVLPSSAGIVDLRADRIRRVVRPLTAYLRSERPDVVLAAMWPLTSATAAAWLLAGRPGTLYLSDHNLLSVSCTQDLGLSPRLVGTAVRWSYRFANGVVAVSNGVKNDLHRLSGLPSSTIRVIYNPAATGVGANRESDEVRTALWGKGFKRHILSVGKLKPVKDQLTLIKAFALLPESLNAKLTILGEGPVRTALESLVMELGIGHRVSLPGFVLDPYPWMRTADLFVLSSKSEGFGNVLVEAMECGLPVVSTDCGGGPSEILENGRFGRLVPVGDPAALAHAIQESLSGPHDIQALTDRAKAFSVPVIADQYLEYFAESRRAGVLLAKGTR